MDYKKNLKYFQPMNLKAAIIACIVGLVFLPVGGGASVAGLAIIAVGVFLIVTQVQGRPTDADIDSAVTSQLTDMKARALRKLGVDEDEVKEIAPITFDGYVYSGAMVKMGKDGKYRSNKYQAVMFFFSGNEVHCFTYDFSITESTGQRESTDVYFYKDIVSVSTQTEGTEYSVGKGKSSRFDYEYFKLTTTGGTSISCSVRNFDDAQRSINGMRSLIKSKKMA